MPIVAGSLFVLIDRCLMPPLIRLLDSCDDFFSKFAWVVSTLQMLNSRETRLIGEFLEAVCRICKIVLGYIINFWK